MNHKPKQNPSNTLIVAAALTFITALAISVFLLPSNKRDAIAAGDMDLTSALLICNTAAPATPAYGNCQTMNDTIAAERTPTNPVEVLNPPYQQFTDCQQAVNYIFQDRVDYPRAIEVVNRESTYNPNARNGAHLGCAQLSTTLQHLFLKGAWNDPYYNVLALRYAVDSRQWGWCHWDIVNYCLPGGEF